MAAKNAIISVSDKNGIVEFAKELAAAGYNILSTGGTSRTLKENGVEVRDISDYTGFPEMMDGRVKTLHPKVHGGILCLRDNADHMSQAEKNDIQMIDLLVVNLYPFQATIAREDCTLEDAIENIDIGGPTMLRSAAKNYRHVTVVTDPADYNKVISEIKSFGSTSEETRAALAVKVFHQTALYDSAIDNWLSKKLNDDESIHFCFDHGKVLRYGENPHQEGRIYYDSAADTPNVPAGTNLHGKDMSFNNYIDADASFETVKEFFPEPAVSIIKHSNPCGLATGKTLSQAMTQAWEGDIVSAFGSVISCTQKVDLATAEFLKGKFVEVLIAPDFEDDALDFLKNKSKDLRLIKVDMDGMQDKPYPSEHCRFVNGALLKQSYDNVLMQKFDTVTKKDIPGSEKGLFEFAYKAVKHTKSNAILICHEYEAGCYMVLGMGAGQPNRVDSVRKLSVTKAVENIKRLYGEDKVSEVMARCVLASDAFFPFPDNIEEASGAGITRIIQPGGSKKDADVIGACNKLGVAMAFTGTRHFYH